MRRRYGTLCICCQPEGAGSELSDLARAAGFATLDLPLVSLKTVGSGVEDAKRFLEQNRERTVGAIFSSKTAVRAARDILGGFNLKIFAVGSKTARELEAYGIEVDLVGESGLEDLYNKIVESNRTGMRLIHICGELSVELPNVQRFVVYRTIVRDLDSSLREELGAVLEKYQDVYWLFTNARSVVRQRELVDSGEIRSLHGVGVAIGASTFAELSTLGFNRCLVAEHPSMEGIIELLVRDVNRS